MGIKSKSLKKMGSWSEYDERGVTVEERWVNVSDSVSLRVITFHPKAPSQKPPILFIAGWVSMVKGWQETLFEMTKDFTVHYIETREKKSSKIQGKVKYSIESIGKDIIALIDYFQFKESQYILFGSSLGATAILDCCRFLSINPCCLILIQPNCVFRIPWFWLQTVRLLYPPLYIGFKYVVLWYLKNFRMNVKHDRGQYEKYRMTLNAADPWKLKKSFLSISKYQVWDLLNAIYIPVLLFGASKDKLHEPGNIEKMVSMIRNTTYIDLETNTNTHSREMVIEIRRYLNNLLKV